MIILPMAGKSKRFYSAGYQVPKYMLDLKSISLFEHSLLSFKKYFKDDKFLFIILDNQNTFEFIKSKINKYEINDYEIIKLKNATNGQAETVFEALKKYKKNTEIYIFNIDTIRPNFSKPKIINNNIDGYLEVFIGQGSNWSFLKHNKSGNVIETSEKNRISRLCCTGLYYFSKSSDFIDAFENLKKNNLKVLNEYYIAPMYNYLIQKNKIIKYKKINNDSVFFSGTPNEYENLKKIWNT
tara:strand:- start:56 stop:775 length:720 start_codon:yes stop_codon:yes gene_type:complete